MGISEDKDALNCEEARLRSSTKERSNKQASERQHIHMCPRIHSEDQNIIISDTGLGLGQGDRRQTCQQGSQCVIVKEGMKE